MTTFPLTQRALARRNRPLTCEKSALTVDDSRAGTFNRQRNPSPSRTALVRMN